MTCTMLHSWQLLKAESVSLQDDSTTVVGLGTDFAEDSIVKIYFTTTFTDTSETGPKGEQSLSALSPALCYAVFPECCSKWDTKAACHCIVSVSTLHPAPQYCNLKRLHPVLHGSKGPKHCDCPSASKARRHGSNTGVRSVQGSTRCSSPASMPSTRG